MPRTAFPLSSFGILHKNAGTTAWSADFKVLYDGIDHPLRVNASGTVAYYELDVIGNVRRLRGVGGTDLGGYRYTAFGKLSEESATVEQPLRWQGPPMSRACRSPGSAQPP